MSIKLNHKNKLSIAIVFMIFFIQTLPVLAAEGDGTGNNSFLNPGSADKWFNDQPSFVKDKIESLMGMFWWGLRIVIGGALLLLLAQYLKSRKEGSDHKEEASVEQKAIRIAIGSALILILIYVTFGFFGWSI
jgi:Na+/proline symporter